MSERFHLSATPIDGLQIVERRPILDQRGFLERLFCAEEFKKLGLFTSVAQINHTLTRAKASVRGMHFQTPPHGDIKLVSCLRGEVFDVAVDLRKDSRTFLHWHAELLTGTNFRSLMVPVGFAHGFQTLTDDCELLYLHSAVYLPTAEGGISHAEPRVGIVWPLPVSGVSVRDANHPFLSTDYLGISL